MCKGKVRIFKKLTGNYWKMKNSIDRLRRIWSSRKSYKTKKKRSLMKKNNSLSNKKSKSGLKYKNNLKKSIRFMKNWEKKDKMNFKKG